MPVGDVIASTTTDPVTGGYSLDFEGSLSADLVVQVTGATEGASVIGYP